MKLPEADLDVDAPDAMAVLAGILTLDIGTTMATARTPSLIWAVGSFYVFSAALVLVFAGLTDIDIERWGRPLAGYALLSLLVAVAVTYIVIRGAPLQTDVLFFVNEAAGDLLAGQSPYDSTYSQEATFPTPLMDGSHVTQFSYPLGGALIAAPFQLMTGDGARLAVITAAAGSGILMVATAPHEWAPLALASLLVGDWLTWGLDGLMGPLWVFPMLGALYFWPFTRTRDSLIASAILLGVSAGIKQFSWFVGPFLLIWLYQDLGKREAVTYAAVSVGTFVLINLPALVLTPTAAVEGILTPLLGDGAAMVHLGVGLSALTMGGVYPIAKGAHTALMVLGAVAYLAAYWYDDRLRWTAWIAWMPLLFLNYRSLMTYFIAGAPVAAYVYILRPQTELEVNDATQSA